MINMQQTKEQNKKHMFRAYFRKIKYLGIGQFVKSAILDFFISQFKSNVLKTTSDKGNWTSNGPSGLPWCLFVKQKVQFELTYFLWLFSLVSLDSITGKLLICFLSELITCGPEVFFSSPCLFVSFLTQFATNFFPISNVCKNIFYKPHIHQDGKFLLALVA